MKNKKLKIFKPQLSVVLTTFNEAKNIKTCLQSIKKLADEIIIIDGSSTDKTRDIAQKLGAKVFKVKNQTMFHKNKQLALEKAKGNWILQLDADEQVSPKLTQEIQKTIESNPKFNGYYIPRKNWFLGKFLKKGGVYPDYVIRLVKNGKAHFPCQSVHEQIKVKGKVGYLKNDLLHYADPDFDRYFSRFNRYTDLTAEKLSKTQIKPSLFNLLNYLLFKPIFDFLNRFFRHKGFIDGYQGFLFALFSSLHHPVAYLKFWQKIRIKKNKSI